METRHDKEHKETRRLNSKTPVEHQPSKPHSPNYSKKERDATGSIQAEEPDNVGTTSSPADEELIRISRDWKPSDWEDYLSSEETYQREDHLSQGEDVEKLSNEDYTAALVEIFHQDDYPNLTKVIGKIIGKLTEKQQRIIRLKYWENKTLREISDILGIRYQSVQDSLRSSQKRIEKQLKILTAKNECRERLTHPSGGE